MTEQDKDLDLEEIRRQQQSAADLIRNKLNNLYAEEPDAADEISEVEDMPKKTMSKHQRYMQGLSDSAKSLAEIQVAWHEYYSALPDSEKHEVWQEFYTEHSRMEHQRKNSAKETKIAHEIQETTKNSSDEQLSRKRTRQSKAVVLVSHNTKSLKSKRRRRTSHVGGADFRTANDIKSELVSNIRKKAEVRKNPHARALAFGLSMGALTLFVLMFGFFNERIITPFIRPNTNVSATPIIVDPDASGPVGPEAKIIIPKINVEAPVIYDVPSIDEDDVQKGLERGVVHYITTPNPGEKGNSVIFGHSSSNILNKGKYKFAFLMLKSLDKDDTFIVQKDGQRFVYKVYNKYVTNPQDLSVLGPTDRPSTMTLITCDPPGTSTNRLIIQAEQIFPDPSRNKASSVDPSAVTSQPEQLPSNAVTLWQRILNAF